jgi:hypothetical protein
MSKEYVLGKLKELEEVIDSISNEDLLSIFAERHIYPEDVKFLRSFNEKKEEPHIYSPEFLRQT